MDKKKGAKQGSADAKPAKKSAKTTTTPKAGSEKEGAAPKTGKGAKAGGATKTGAADKTGTAAKNGAAAKPGATTKAGAAGKASAGGGNKPAAKAARVEETSVVQQSAVISPENSDICHALDHKVGSCPFATSYSCCRGLTSVYPVRKCLSQTLLYTDPCPGYSCCLSRATCPYYRPTTCAYNYPLNSCYSGYYCPTLRYSRMYRSYADSLNATRAICCPTYGRYCPYL